MKALLVEYAAYNVWANQRISETVLLLTQEQQLQTLVSSFSSLHHTLLHLLDAESIWWQRLKMHDSIIRHGEAFKGNTRDVVSLLLQQDKLWESWIQISSVAALEHEFHYQNSKKEKFRQPTYQMILHLFNHSTYHRGQLVTMMRNIGQEIIPATDFIVYSRLKK